MAMLATCCRLSVTCRDDMLTGYEKLGPRVVRRAGTGRALYRAAADWATQEGASKIDKLSDHATRGAPTRSDGLSPRRFVT